MKKTRYFLFTLLTTFFCMTSAQAEDVQPVEVQAPQLAPTLPASPTPPTLPIQEATATVPVNTLPAANPTPTTGELKAYDGKVVDATTQTPIQQALITLGDTQVRTQADGTFHIEGRGETLKFRAPGYTKQEIPLADYATQSTISLTPFKVKALFLTGYGLASHQIRNKALEVMRANKMNALVIDMKGDRGLLTFKVDVPFAQEIGAHNKILIKDAKELIEKLKQQNIYLIARIVTFKDDVLATAKPEWAVRKGGEIFRDREKLRWADPFRPEVWNYNIAIAKEAAELGFDEVQFDYVRCPDTKGVIFSTPSNRETRVKAITTFLESAHKALTPYNVMVSADIFGYVPWNVDDTGIGQEIDKVANAVDVVSLMLYPSGFQFGIPSYRNPITHAYEIVHLSLKRAQERTGVSPLRFRPWLQAFRDYAFNGGNFAEARMRTQIKASNDAGASGYMFWNPRNVYPTGQFD